MMLQLILTSFVLLQPCLGSDSCGAGMCGSEDASLVQLRAMPSRHAATGTGSQGEPSSAHQVTAPRLAIKASNAFKLLITDLSGLFTSASNPGVFSIGTAEVIHWNASLGLPLGNSSYPDVLLPDVDASMAGDNPLVPWHGTNFNDFFKESEMGLLRRLDSFVGLMDKVPKGVHAYEYFLACQTNAKLAIASASKDGPAALNGFPAMQGSLGVWDTDRFAAEYIGHTLMAIFLESTPAEAQAHSTYAPRKGFVLDLSGDSKAGMSTLQKLKSRAVNLAPTTLLRTRGYFTSGAKSPALTKVEVFDTDSHKWMIFAAETATKEQWSLAKSALVSMALFNLECFHTGIHLFSGTVVLAAQNSLATSSELYGMLTPQTTAVLFALLEQVSTLHSNHSSVFSGGVWDSDIVGIQALTQDMSQFFFESSPKEILGMDKEERPQWWAGMSDAFEAPITEFAESVAAEVHHGDIGLQRWAANLKEVGGYKGAGSVETTEGIANLFRNMMFMQGICHTHMYGTREAMTALAGFTSTAEMLPYLRGESHGFKPETTDEIRFWMTIIWNTAIGFDKGVPELGDGPWPGSDENAVLRNAVDKMQSGMNETRASVQAFFGNDYDGGYLPSFFYPKDTPKPFGFGFSQTTYI